MLRHKLKEICSNKPDLSTPSSLIAGSFIPRSPLASGLITRSVIGTAIDTICRRRGRYWLITTSAYSRHFA